MLCFVTISLEDALHDFWIGKKQKDCDIAKPVITRALDCLLQNII